MSISSKQVRKLAKQFGLDPADLAATLTEQGITSVEQATAFLQADTGEQAPAEQGGEQAPEQDGASPDHGAQVSAAANEQAILDACRANGVASKGWVRFLTGNGTEDLKSFYPAYSGTAAEAARVVGIWKAGGKGMNVRKLVVRLQNSAAPAAAPAAV